MSLHLYPYDLPPIADLSADQLDGIGCVYCPADTLIMPGDKFVPVGRIRGCQVFAHEDCAQSHKWED